MDWSIQFWAHCWSRHALTVRPARARSRSSFFVVTLPPTLGSIYLYWLPVKIFSADICLHLLRTTARRKAQPQSAATIIPALNKTSLSLNFAHFEISTFCTLCFALDLVEWLAVFSTLLFIMHTLPFFQNGIRCYNQQAS